MTIEFRHISLSELETRLDEGTFEGYANLHDGVDSYGTHFTRGAWASGGLDGDRYALLWMHDENRPIGTFTAVEDDRGLRIIGQYDDTPDGQMARACAKSGSAGELSVGFIRKETDKEDRNAITSAKLIEVSQITARMASQPGAELTAVRKAEAEDKSVEEALAEVEERSRPCVGCGRGVRRPVCSRCRAKGVSTTREMDDQRETRETDPPDGSYEAIIAEVVDAIENWADTYYGNDDGSDTYLYVVNNATYPDRCVATVYGSGIDSDGDTWEFPYVTTADGTVTVGQPKAMEIVMTVQPAEPEDVAEMGRNDVERERVRALARLKLRSA